jgi:hypothetical protein
MQKTEPYEALVSYVGRVGRIKVDGVVVAGKHFRKLRNNFGCLEKMITWVCTYDSKSGLPDGPNLGKFWRALELKLLVHLMAVLNILQPSGIFYGR